MKKLFEKLQRFLLRKRLHPIHVYTFHHVSEERDSLVAAEEDWTQWEQFKHNIEVLQSRYTFISIREAYDKLKDDTFRWKDYAVLTTDDGLKGVLLAAPWLEERNIPLCCFVNTKYLDGVSHKKEDEDRIQAINVDADIAEVVSCQYMTRAELWNLTSENISIGMHGHEHLDTYSLSKEGIEQNVDSCFEVLKHHPRFVPFFAYPWGHHTPMADECVQSRGLVPVWIDKKVNYNNPTVIHRELLDNIKL